MREDQVTNGVTFLTHPKVQQASLAERMQFLKNKGLTEEEIEEARKRANEQLGIDENESEEQIKPIPTNQGGPNGPGPVMYQPPPKPQDSWLSRVLVPGTLALSAGAGIAFLYKTMVLKEGMMPPWGMGPPPPGLPPPPGQGPLALPPGPPPALPPGVNPNPAQQQMEQMVQQPPQTPQQLQGQLHQQQQQQTSPPPNNDNNSALVANTSPSQLVPMSPDNMYGQAPYDKNASSLSTSLTTSNNSISNQSDTSGLARIIEKQTDILNDISKKMVSLTDKMEKIEKESKEKVETPHLLANINNVNGDVKAELRAIKTLLLANHMVSSGKSGSEGEKDVSGLIASMEAAEQQLGVYEQKKSIEAAPVEKEDPMDKLIKASKAPTGDKNEKEKDEKEKDEAPEKSDDEIREEKLRKCRETLALLHRDCSEEKLKPAVQTLLLYLSNLINNWDAIPYGRISTNNPTYLKSLKEVDHHLDFLRSCGFEEISASKKLEFSSDWREAKDKWAEAVLKDAKKNLESIQTELKKPKEKKETPSASSEPKTTKQVSSSPSYEEIMSRNKTAAAPAPSKAEPNVNAASSEATSKSESESYPKSFFEISKMLQKDKDWTPPDAKVIPNTLSEDASKFQPSAWPTSKPVPKPWEKTNESDKDATTEEDDKYHPSLFDGIGAEVSPPGNSATSFDDFLRKTRHIDDSSPTIEELPDDDAKDA